MQHYREALNNARKNHKETWNLLRQLVPGKSKQTKCNFQNPTRSASTFNNFFATAGEKWSEVVAVWQNLRFIFSQAGLQLLNVLVTLTLSHRSFNYDTDHGSVWITLGDWHCGLETFMLGSRSEPMQSSITACSTDQSANHLHHRGDERHQNVQRRKTEASEQWTWWEG